MGASIRYYHAALTDNNIVAMPPVINGTVLFISSLSLFLKYVFFVGLIYAPAYPFWALHTWHLFLLPVVPAILRSCSSQPDCLSLSVSPGCCYTCILLSYLCLVLSVSCVSMPPRLARSTSLGPYVHKLVLAVFWACAMRMWHRQLWQQRIPHAYPLRSTWTDEHTDACTHGHTDTRLNALPPSNQMWGLLTLTPNYIHVVSTMPFTVASSPGPMEWLAWTLQCHLNGVEQNENITIFFFGGYCSIFGLWSLVNKPVHAVVIFSLLIFV